MFKRMTHLVVGAMALSVSVGVMADNYAGGNFASIDGLENSSLPAIYGRLGTEFNENFSGEIRLGIGVGDDDVNVLGTPVTLELNNLFGAYIRGGIPITEKFYPYERVFPYAVLGYTRGEVEASGLGGSVDNSNSDVSFGVGVDIDVNESLTVNAEYMNWIGTELNGFTIGIATKF